MYNATELIVIKLALQFKIDAIKEQCKNAYISQARLNQLKAEQAIYENVFNKVKASDANS